MLMSVSGYRGTKKCQFAPFSCLESVSASMLNTSNGYCNPNTSTKRLSTSSVATARMTLLDALSITVSQPSSSTYIPGAIMTLPPPYSSVASSLQNTNSIVPPPAAYSRNESNSKVNGSKTSTSSYIDTDIDVVGLTDEARDVRLSDDDDDEKCVRDDEPLDLSMKKRAISNCSATCSSSPSPSSAQPRPSVIRNGYVGRHSDMRRSASSVTSRPATEPDVSEHFRRSLSGKWPRRQANHSHYTPLQSDKDKLANGFVINRKNGQTPSSAPSSCNAARRSPPSSPPQQIIVNNSGIEIEDHFRKALGAEAYELLRKSRQTNHF